MVVQTGKQVWKCVVGLHIWGMSELWPDKTGGTTKFNWLVSSKSNLALGPHCPDAAGLDADVGKIAKWIGLKATAGEY